MDILQESKDVNKKSFLSHVFSTTEESKAEFLNVFQYASLAVIPIVILNKLVQRFVPEADLDKSSLELLVEIFLQLLVMFGGIIIIHRVITYIPTFSGFKYENLTLTSVILAFLVIILSIQTKMGIKVNLLVDRVSDMWNGDSDDKKKNVKKRVRINEGMSSQHQPSQADYLDNSQVQQGSFPPAPVVSSRGPVSGGYDHMMRGSGMDDGYDAPILAANSLLGSSFGASF